MGEVPVPSFNSVGEDAEACLVAVGELSVDQKVADHFAEDGVAQANPLCALNIGHFRQILLDEGHDAVVGSYEVATHLVAVVIEFGVADFAEDVGFVLRQVVENDGFLAEENKGGEGVAVFAGVVVFAPHAGGFQEFLVGHAGPRVYAAACMSGGRSTHFVEGGMVEIIQCQVGEHPVLGIGFLFLAEEEVGNLVLRPKDEVALMVAVVVHSLASVGGGAFRDV